MHEPPEAETQEPEEYYDTEDGNAQQYYGHYGEGDAEDVDGSLEHPIDLTAVDGGDGQPADDQQARGDPNAYTGDQDVDEVSTLEGSPSQEDQPALSEAEAGGELVSDEGAGADPVLVNAQAGVTVQRRASGYKRRHEDVEAEENEHLGTWFRACEMFPFLTLFYRTRRQTCSTRLRPFAAWATCSCSRLQFSIVPRSVIRGVPPKSLHP